jgi:hypothetical protein
MHEAEWWAVRSWVKTGPPSAAAASVAPPAASVSPRIAHVTPGVISRPARRSAFSAVGACAEPMMGWSGLAAGCATDQAERADSAPADPAPAAHQAPPLDLGWSGDVERLQTALRENQHLREVNTQLSRQLHLQSASLSLSSSSTCSSTCSSVGDPPSPPLDGVGGTPARFSASGRLGKGYQKEIERLQQELAEGSRQQGTARAEVERLRHEAARLRHEAETATSAMMAAQREVRCVKSELERVQREHRQQHHHNHHQRGGGAAGGGERVGGAAATPSAAAALRENRRLSAELARLRAELLEAQRRQRGQEQQEHHPPPPPPPPPLPPSANEHEQRSSDRDTLLAECRAELQAEVRKLRGQPEARKLLNKLKIKYYLRVMSTTIGILRCLRIPYVFLRVRCRADDAAQVPPGQKSGGQVAI